MLFSEGSLKEPPTLTTDFYSLFSIIEFWCSEDEQIVSPED